MADPHLALQGSAVFVGAGLGGTLRWLVGLALNPADPEKIPYHILTVNMVGSFLIGLAYFLFAQKETPVTWHLFAVTGILGGFTTFSTFSLDTLLLIQKGRIGMALVYGLGSCLLGVALAWLGLTLAQRLGSS